MKNLLFVCFAALISLPANAQSNLYVNSTNGNVGIGTTTPVNTLDVSSGGGIHITSGVPSSTSMALYNNAGTLTWNGTALGTGSSVSGTTNYIPVFTAANVLGNSIIYQSGINIGIGTTSPVTPLHIYHVLPTGTISSSGNTVTGSGSNFTSAFSVGDLIMAGNQNQTISSISSNTSLTTVSAFTPVLSAGAPYQRVGAVLNAGAVGIGISNPEAPLDVWGTPIINGANRAVVAISDATPLAANAGGGLEFGGYVTSTIGAEWAGIKSGKVNGTSGDYGAYMAFMTRTNGSPTAERMRIDNLGHVGIGTTAPSYTLTVNGTAWVTSGAWSGSDRRWKKDVVPLKGMLEKILKLQGVNYTWRKEDFPEKHFVDGRQIGLIAQDTGIVLPELVTTDKDGYEGIAYEKLTPVLVEAIKELKEESNNQIKMINELRHDFDTYRKAHP